MSFQIHAMSQDAVSHAQTVRSGDPAPMEITVDASPGYPCRVSLEDAQIGERVTLFHHCHLPANSPFRASHAIYVRHGAEEAKLAPGEVPDMLRSRMISLRAFDEASMMRDATLVEGKSLETALTDVFTDPEIAFVHLHFAAPGCFAAHVSRV